MPTMKNDYNDTDNAINGTTNSGDDNGDKTSIYIDDNNYYYNNNDKISNINYSIKIQILLLPILTIIIITSTPLTIFFFTASE